MIHHYFKAVCLTHQKASLDLRGTLALDEVACRQLLHTLRDDVGLSDLLVLSTCNRTEIYYAAEHNQSARIIKALADLKGITDQTKLAALFTSITDAEQAVQHLFEVAMGLQAQVVGDQQISHQVKQAYQWSADADTAGPFLHRLLHSIFFTHKRVQQETAFRDGAASTSYATLELIERMTRHVAAPRVLLVGLGEIGADVCRHFAESKEFASVTVCNRTRAKAEAMANEHQVHVLDFADLAQGLQEADVVISSVATAVPLITQVGVKQLAVRRHKFFVDLAVPRSIEANVEDVPGVLLYTLDDIQSHASAALNRRLAAVPQVRSIIAESLANFGEWSSEMTVSPTIQKLKNALEQLRQQEMQRFQKKMSVEEAGLLDEMTKSLMQRVLKQPVLQLKAACKRGETGPLMETLSTLFDLEKQLVTVSGW